MTGTSPQEGLYFSVAIIPCLAPRWPCSVKIILCSSSYGIIDLIPNLRNCDSFEIPKSSRFDTVIATKAGQWISSRARENFCMRGLSEKVVIVTGGGGGI